jgi:hypothetical protein
MRKYAILALLTILPPLLSAARITLRDGTVVYGQFISGNSQDIVFQDDNGVRRRFNTTQVQTLDFDSVNTTANRVNNYPAPRDNPPRDGYYEQRSGTPANNNTAYRNDNTRYQNDWTVLPAGTSISVRTDQDINSQNAAEGRTFPASIMQDVLDANGNIVIPRGSLATLIVRRVTQPDTLSSGSYALDLESVRVNGHRYVVNTADVNAGEQGIGKNRRTAEYVGGGAVLGTLLGAIAGGGKGAAIGAVAGAAAGGGAQVLTKGHEIRVPAETILNFRLEEPLHLREG